jgi:Spy/CpxP family protein refolding chaperone
MSLLLRSTAIGLVFVITAALDNSASSQEPGGRPPSMGFGGMSGLFQPNDFFWARLLRSEKVQVDLKLTDDQKAKLKELDDKIQAQFRELMPSRDSMTAMRDLTTEQRDAKVAEMRKKIERLADEQQDAIEKLLSTDHIDRLEQIGLQVRGAQSLEDKEVQEALGLDAEQKDKIKKIREEATKKRSEIFAEGNFRDMRDKMTALQKDTDAKIMALLSPKQADKFDKLKGPKIEGDPSELLGRGFGGRGPR